MPGLDKRICSFDRFEPLPSLPRSCKTYSGMEMDRYMFKYELLRFRALHVKPV